MFIVEKLVRDHEARNEAWERARDKWKAKNDYYSNRDYEDRYPRPGHWLKLVGKSILVGLLIAALVGTVLSVTVGGEHHKAKHNQAATQVKKPDNTSYTFKVDDKVQVVYGDYENSVGVIIKLEKNSAIIKLTNSTLTHAMCNASSSCSSGGGHDNGELLGISDLDNLVPYKEVK